MNAFDVRRPRSTTDLEVLAEGEHASGTGVPFVMEHQEVWRRRSGPSTRFTEAIPFFEKAISLSPYDPQRWAFYSYRALAHLLAGQFEDALAWAYKATRLPNCHYWPFAHRVAALGHLHDIEGLPLAKSELLQHQPAFSCAFAKQRLFYIKNPAHVERYVQGLRKAGLAE